MTLEIPQETRTAWVKVRDVIVAFIVIGVFACGAIAWATAKRVDLLLGVQVKRVTAIMLPDEAWHSVEAGTLSVDPDGKMFEFDEGGDADHLYLRGPISAAWEVKYLKELP